MTTGHSSALIISIEELRALAINVFDALQEQKYESFELTSDYYWQALPPERYEFSEFDPELCIGSVAEDIEFCRSSLVDNSVVVESLARLGNVLLCIGHRQFEDDFGSSLT